MIDNRLSQTAHWASPKNSLECHFTEITVILEILEIMEIMEVLEVLAILEMLVKMLITNNGQKARLKNASRIWGGMLDNRMRGYSSI